LNHPLEVENPEFVERWIEAWIPGRNELNVQMLQSIIVREMRTRTLPNNLDQVEFSEGAFRALVINDK
jgi:hypothetical protein